jgi:hypothetical protein
MRYIKPLVFSRATIFRYLKSLKELGFNFNISDGKVNFKGSSGKLLSLEGDEPKIVRLSLDMLFCAVDIPYDGAQIVRKFAGIRKV